MTIRFPLGPVRHRWVTAVAAQLQRPWVKIVLFALAFLACWLSGMRTAHAVF